MNNNFIIILWQPVYKYFDEILKKTENIGTVDQYYDIKVQNKNILKFVYKIYEKDSKFKKLCKNKLLEKKSKSLECNINIIRIIDIKINNPTFTEKKSCHEIINLKKNIRDHYMKYTNDFNNIIHGCDNLEDSQNVRNIIKNIKKNDY